MAKENQFTNTTPKDTSKTKSYSINLAPIGKWALIALATIAAAAFIGIQAYQFSSKVLRAKEAMIFAYNYPELVDPVAEQYTAELESLKDSVIKRQVVNGGDITSK